MDMILSLRSNDHLVLNDKLQTLIEIMDHLESKANDIEREVRNEEFQSRKKRKSEVKLWLERVSEIKEDTESIRREVENVGSGNSKRLLNEIKGMLQYADELLKQAGLFKGLVLDDLKPEGIELVTEKLEGCTPLEVQNEVWSALLRGESRIGIYGMGGVGKTSVAKHINNEILAGRDDFKHVYYVTVSRDSSVHKLQGDISRALQLQLQTEDHETRRASELRMSLKKRKKSVLILDDVWEYIPMEEVGVAVEGDGCKLLITTRKRDVCHKMNCSSIVEMRPLLEKEAWDLFVIQLGTYEQLSNEAKSIAISICKECSGLPLAIITMARCMRGESDEHVWREMLRQLRNPCSNQDDMDIDMDMDSKVFSILKLSYERLKNDKLRDCLLYCALYPEDYEIRKDDLIKGFIAVGLLDGSTRKENIDKGHFILNVLQSASLLECVTDFGGLRCVKMHDLIRDMALKIIGREGNVEAGKGLKEIPRKDEWTWGLVRVSLMDNYIKGIGDEICPECPNLSVLILRDNPLQNISDSFFAHMACLRYLDLSYTMIVKLPNSVANLCNLGALLLNDCLRLKVIPSLAGLTKLRNLDLSESGIEELPGGVEELINLRYLDLSSTGIQELPKGVEELINLEYLDLSSTGIQELPKGVEGLINLEHLDLSSTGIHELPKGIEELINLAYLDLFRTGIQELPKGIEGLINLEHLDVTETRIQNIPDALLCKLCKLKSFLSNSKISILPKKLTSLRQLSSFAGWVADFDAFKQFVGWDCFYQLKRYFFHVGGPIEYYDISFESRDRRIIIIRDCQLSIRREVCFEVPHNIQILELIGCSFGVECLLEALPSLCAATELERCKLEHCKGIKYIIPDAWFERGGYQPFKRLCQLDLLHLDDFVGLYEGREVHTSIFFGGLRELRIEGCPSVHKIWLQNDDLLPNLESIQVEECNNMEQVFVTTGGASIKLPKLEKVVVERCPKLEKLWSVKDELPSLQYVVVEYCDQIKEFFTSTDETTIKWPNLCYLSLQSLPELESICRNGFFPKLENLEVYECPKLKKPELLQHSMPSVDQQQSSFS